ncbi:hypothetical protein L6452_39971 [Arctium lappa]|uniref:Uncharacterized protein n=1 Tax=Arctium lappa TaxID=4217 RepID=A0ACB8XUG1_ARCLA|nr:hypothetical protein L6452_39971 [Arctium lappa]
MFKLHVLILLIFMKCILGLILWLIGFKNPEAAKPNARYKYLTITREVTFISRRTTSSLGLCVFSPPSAAVAATQPPPSPPLPLQPSASAIIRSRFIRLNPYSEIYRYQALNMADYEGETLPDAVTDYYFCDGGEEPLSFSKLPLKWDESESSSSDTEPIFLRCTADNGLETLYKQVKAWKYDFSKENLEISVHYKDNHWFKLQKPRKSYENEIRTILITVQCLYFFKCEPKASGQALWDHLSQVFRLYDVRPSENDLIDHMDFIRQAIKRDETLAKSKFLVAFLENPGKRKFPDEDAETATKARLIVADMNVDERHEDDLTTKPTVDSEPDEEVARFDTVCAICDNGGELICCEEECFRSFHATVESEGAADNYCTSLGLPPEVEKGAEPFRCENCLYKRHQCFVCGELGSSDKSSVAEVFRCSSANCGHFYHPRCVATLLQQYGEAEPQDLEQKIAVGEPFICPAHKCVVCKQTESPKVKDLQFAVCRRCPTSYHRKCLPREIKFDYQVGDDELPRAWDELLPKSRALIFCLEHVIDEEMGTPARNLKFKNICDSKMDQLAVIVFLFLFVLVEGLGFFILKE